MSVITVVFDAGGNVARVERRDAKAKDKGVTAYNVVQTIRTLRTEANPFGIISRNYDFVELSRDIQRSPLLTDEQRAEALTLARGIDGIDSIEQRGPVRKTGGFMGVSDEGVILPASEGTVTGAARMIARADAPEATATGVKVVTYYIDP